MKKRKAIILATGIRTQTQSLDIAECYENATKAKCELGWTATYDIKDMCRDAWRFEKRITNKRRVNLLTRLL